MICNSLIQLIWSHGKLPVFPDQAIGLRMAAENEADQRARRMRSLQGLIAEKKAELDRYNTQFQSLERIEAEQRAVLEKMSSS